MGTEFIGHAVVAVVNGERMAWGRAEAVDGNWVEIREAPSVEAVVAATVGNYTMPRGQLSQWPVSSIHFDLT